MTKSEIKEQVKYLQKIVEKNGIKNTSLDSLINEFDSITADIHKLCAEYFSEKFITHKYGILYEAKEKTYARYTNIQGKIDSYIRKLEQLSAQENLDKLYNENKLVSSISDTELSRDDAKSGLSELNQMYKHCRDENEKEYLLNIKTGYENAINTLLRLVVNLINQNGRIALLKNKDFSYL